MTGRVAGKVALVTGAARGQGRSHAVRLAQEGADILAVDICRQIDSVPYPMSTPEDLDDTARAVKDLGRNVVAVQADIRERAELREAVDAGIRTLGKLDVVVANAGIFPIAMGKPDITGWFDAIDVDLVGAMNTVAVAQPYLPDGASIVITGSFAAMIHGYTDNPAVGPGGNGYDWAKHMIPEYVEQLAWQLAPRFIRVNAVHPTTVATHMFLNEGMYKIFRPDLESPTREDAEVAACTVQAMPIPYIEPIDVSNAVLYFASDESRYVTGTQHRIDAGAYLKMRALSPEKVKT